MSRETSSKLKGKRRGLLNYTALFPLWPSSSWFYAKNVLALCTAPCVHLFLQSRQLGAASAGTWR